MRVRVYPSAAGVRVLIPNPRLQQAGESDDVFLARVANHAAQVDPTLDAVAGVDLAHTELPPDRDFRSAWTLDGAACTIDWPKAREVHRAHLRRARAPKLAELDASYLRELERGLQGKPNDVVAKKQVLRDLPQNIQIDAASSAAELRALWPTALLGETPYTGQ